MPCVLKFLTPEALASAVIGKGGAVIKGMRESTGAKIAVSEHSDFFPGTDCRVLTAQANTEEALAEVATQLIAKLSECVQAAPSEQLGSPGELRLRTLMPRAAVGGIIGKGGAAIKQLRDQSGAKVSISDADAAGPGAEQVVTMSGPQQAIEYVMAEVNKQVQALSAEAWFALWAASGGRNGSQGYTAAAAVAPPWSAGNGAGGGRLQQWSPAASNSGVDLMVNVARTLPQYVMEDSRGFALSCVVPNRLVGGLIGRGGNGTKEVQQLTGTKIGIREIPGDPDNRSMNIAGPLSNTCAAYMLMMKRYLDAEQAAEAGGGGRLSRR